MRTNLRSQLRTLANKDANRRECRVNSQPPNSLYNINDSLAERVGSLFHAPTACKTRRPRSTGGDSPNDLKRKQNDAVRFNAIGAGSGLIRTFGNYRSTSLPSLEKADG